MEVRQWEVVFFKIGILKLSPLIVIGEACSA
jgi:hypothetical protein